jgi:hypothetical protein
VLFHGSGRDDLDVLEPIRRSRDTTQFGDQEAVYATSDPVWAMYFALLRRGRSFSTAQWVSSSAVRPVGRIAVEPSDFPFRDLVVAHREREPMFRDVVAGGRARTVWPDKPSKSRSPALISSAVGTQ